MDETYSTLFSTIYEMGQRVFDFFTITINDIIQRFGIDVTVPVFGDWSFFGLMFGGGIFLYLAYTIVTWILDILP